MTDKADFELFEKPPTEAITTDASEAGRRNAPSDETAAAQYLAELIRGLISDELLKQLLEESDDHPPL